MKINKEFVNSFSSAIDSDSVNRNELKKTLISGRAVRLQSGKETHFWELNQKNIHHDFDQVFSRGIEKLSLLPSSETPSLLERVSPETPLSKKINHTATTLAKSAAIGLGTFAGWFVGFAYTNSMTNLALHEHGHAWAMNQLYTNADPTVSSNALYWLEHHDWYNWFFGVREGAPGNWTAQMGSNLSAWGQALTSTERDLFVSFAGIGAELAFNTTVAGLGLLAIRRKHRVLGGALLGFAFIAHSAADSYIRRFPKYLHENIQGNGGGADPTEIAHDLSSILGCSSSQAFQMLWYGYFFLPIFLIVILGILFLPMPKEFPQEIPDECVLMRLLTQSSDPELKKIMAEVEVEIGENPTEKPAELTYKISESLLTKIKNNPKTLTLFEQTRSEIAAQLKGKFHATTSLTTRLAAVALIVSFIAYQMLAIFQSFNPWLKTLFDILSKAFIGLQGVATILGLIKTYSDLQNEKLSKTTKGLSVGTSSLNIATLGLIITGLFTPGLNAIILPVLLISAAIRLMIQFISWYTTRQQAIALARPVQVPSGDPVPQT